jgi:hypothetical protein
MVEKRSKAIMKDRGGKGICEEAATPRKITASTLYDTCTERLSPFGGLLGLIKFLDLLRFEEVFDYVYREPGRKKHVALPRQVALLRFNQLVVQATMNSVNRFEKGKKSGDIFGGLAVNNVHIHCRDRCSLDYGCKTPDKNKIHPCF